MKILKNILIRACFVAMLPLMTVACQTKKTIPDEDLVNIFHDAFLANAYLSTVTYDSDSLKVYEPIFERYGYTLEDMHRTIGTFSERKSAMLSDIVTMASERLSEEARYEAYKVMILDTIDRVAQRAFTRTIVSDTLIRATRLKDSSKLRIRLNDVVPGSYTVSFEYLIDSLDENRNSRVEVYLLTRDSSQVMRHTTMLSRRRKSKYTRKLQVDTSHVALFINMYYHPKGEESKLPDINIYNFEIERVLPAATAVDSLYNKQLNVRLFNHKLMSSFTADTLRHDDAAQNTETNEPQDSVTLRTN